MERNVVRLRAAVSLGGALRDIPKNGCRGEYHDGGWQETLILVQVTNCYIAGLKINFFVREPAGN